MMREHTRIRDDDHTVYPAEKSCKQHYLKNRKADGTYMIDPDESGIVAPFKVWCNMSSDDDLNMDAESSNGS